MGLAQTCAVESCSYEWSVIEDAEDGEVLENWFSVERCEAFVSGRARVFARSSGRSIDDVLLLGEQVGKGTFGCVCEGSPVVRSPNTTQGGKLHIAVKAFVKPAHSDAIRGAQIWMARRRSFEAERSSLAALEHPHIAQLCECFEEDSSLHLAIEFCAGGELFGLIVAEAGLSEQLAQRVFWQMASAVAFLHAVSLVHRDIKPENFLFLDRVSDTIKLCDFGSAVRLTKARPRVRQPGGTIVYMPPEMHSGRGVASAADNWGLGCVLYAMLVGKHPFKDPGSTDVDQMSRICTGSFDRQHAHWQGLSEMCRDIVGRFLLVSEEHRLTSVQALPLPWISAGGPLAVGGGLGIPEIAAAVPQVIGVLQVFTGLDELQRLFLSICARLPSHNLQQAVRPRASAAATASLLYVAQVDHHEPEGNIDVSLEDSPMTSSLTPWYELFVHLDSDLDGRLCYTEFVRGLGLLSPFTPNAPLHSLDEFAAKLDVDGSGYIEWAEWCTLPLIAEGGDALVQRTEPIASAHRVLDAPTLDGMISAGDLSAYLADGNPPARSSQTRVAAVSETPVAADRYHRLANLVAERAGEVRTADGAPGLKESAVRTMLSSDGLLGKAGIRHV